MAPPLVIWCDGGMKEWSGKEEEADGLERQAQILNSTLSVRVPRKKRSSHDLQRTEEEILHEGQADWNCAVWTNTVLIQPK